MMTTENNQTPTKRLLSLDALRGFDMFWIIGGEGIFAALAVLTGWPALQWWEHQLTHTGWNGFTFYDVIFPLFLFIAGITFPFSVAKRGQNGGSRKSLYIQIIKRGLILVLFGMIYNGLLSFDFANLRCASVLGRIGLAWMFAALIFINTKRNSRIFWCVGLLIFYWLLLTFMPAPDFPDTEKFSVRGNFASYFDRMFLPGRLNSGIHDPEGLLSTIPAIATALLGMFTGQFVMWKKAGMTGQKRTVYMAVAGIALLLLGLAWNTVFPINKNLWTSSFVCITGGLSLLLFSVFYLVIDVWEYRKWTFFFKVIGMNSITIYMAQRIIDFGYTSDFLFVGLIGWFPESWAAFLNSCGYTAIGWLLLYFLYRQKLFLKV